MQNYIAYTANIKHEWQSALEFFILSGLYGSYITKITKTYGRDVVSKVMSSRKLFPLCTSAGMGNLCMQKALSRWVIQMSCRLNDLHGLI